VKGVIGGAWSGLTAGGAALRERLSSLWGGLQSGFTSGLGGLTERGRAMIDGLRAAASGVTSRLSSMWQGLTSRAGGLTGEGGGLAARALRAVIQRIVSAGQRVWGGIQTQWQSLRQRTGGWLSGVADRARGAWDSVKRRASGVWDGIKGAWTGVRTRVTQAADRLTGGIRGIWGRIRSFSFGGVISKLTQYVPWIKQIRAAADDPESAIAPYVGGISDKLTATPQKAQEIIAEKGGGAQPAAQAPAPAPGPVLARKPLSTSGRRTIQRDARGTAAWGEIWDGLVETVTAKWRQLNVKQLVKDMLWTLIWPWPTVIHEFVAMGTEWKAAVSTFYMPRNLLEDPLGCLHDVWSNLLKVLDFPIILWRHLMNAGLALMGWVTVFLMIAGAIEGAAAGTVVGAVAGFLAGLWIGAAPGAGGGAAGGGLAGAGAGFGVAMGIGEALVIGYAAGEGAALLKALLELKTGRQTPDEQVRDYNQVADSGLGLAILAILVMLGWIAGRLATMVASRLARFIPTSVRDAAARFAAGVRSVREKPPGERTPDEEPGGKPGEEPTTPVAKGPLQGRIQRVLDAIERVRRGMSERGETDPALEQKLADAEARTRDLQRRLDDATTEEELTRIGSETRDAEKAVYELEVEGGKITLRGRVQTLRERLRVARERLQQVAEHDPTTAGDMPATGRPLTPQEALNRRGTRALLDEIQAIERDLDAAARDTDAATSQNRIDNLRTRLDDLEKRAEAVERTPMLGERGLRPEADQALRDLEEVKADPVGDVNSIPNKNHYRAARQEARNIPLEKRRPDGSPWSHIRDLQVARGRLQNIIETLEAELANPLPTLTDEGIAQLITKIDNARAMLNRLDGFLNEIGWPASRPHRWIQQPDGTWVGEGDVPVMRPRVVDRLNGIRERAQGTQRDIARLRDRDVMNALLEQRRQLLNDIDPARTRAEGAQTEVQVRASETEADALQGRLDQLQLDIQNARSGAPAP
jgi:predicted  nucleic acid-binding Zn-ribbon protein